VLSGTIALRVRSLQRVFLSAFAHVVTSAESNADGELERVSDTPARSYRALGQPFAAGAGAGAAQEAQGGRSLQLGAPPVQTLDTMLSVNIYKGELARWLWCLTRSSLNTSDSESTHQSE